MRARWAHPQKGPNVSSKVFVGNLEFSTTRDQIQELFAEAGSILDVFLPTDRATGKPRGFAFVEYGSDAEAEAAIQRFDGYELGGRSLRVNAAQARTPVRPGSFGNNSGGGGFGQPPSNRFGGGKSKGSRRNVRAKKRSL
jgi:cold-inducible RNA-binding protein